MTVRPNAEKINKSTDTCKTLLAKTVISIRDLSSVIRLIGSCFPGVVYGPLHYK